MDYMWALSFTALQSTTSMRLLTLVAAVSTLLNFGLPSQAGIVVVNNRSESPILLDTNPNDHLPASALAPGSSIALYQENDSVISVTSKAGSFKQPLQSNSIYYLSEGNNQLRKISLLKNDQLPPKLNIPLKVAQPPTIRLAVYVDEEEAMTDRQWQNRLSKRIKSASEILETHLGVKLAIDSYNRWISDNNLRGLEPLLAEFERQVKPPPGVIAVGFSSQLHIHPSRRRNMGGTRGPLRSHLIVKEWAPRVTEVERTEILLHEIGHYLGASHSPEANSVMRPVLARSSTRLKSHPIQFDPLNTFAMAIVSQELASQAPQKLEQISPSNRLLLSGVYSTLGELMPQDPSSPRMLQRVQLDPNRKGDKHLASQDIHSLVRSTLSEITAVATANRKRPLVGTSNVRLKGDNLSNLYVRTAARHLIKDSKPSLQQSEALLYALTLAFDRNERLKNFPFFRKLAEKADTERNRQLRSNVIGQPTAKDREDTLLHFLISAALTLQTNSDNARFIGFSKEAFDAQPGGSGFSFADIAANEAGIRFAERLASGKLPLGSVASRFDVNLFIPSLEGLPEGMSDSEYLKEYGGLGDKRNDAMLQEIQNRLDRLPPYLKLELKIDQP